jgi:hypothetical protein
LFLLNCFYSFLQKINYLLHFPHITLIQPSALSVPTFDAAFYSSVIIVLFFLPSWKISNSMYRKVSVTYFSLPHHTFSRVLLVTKQVSFNVSRSSLSLPYYFHDYCHFKKAKTFSGQNSLLWMIIHRIQHNLGHI